MKSVQVDRTFLEELAKTTGGRTVPLSNLESFRQQSAAKQRSAGRDLVMADLAFVVDLSDAPLLVLPSTGRFVAEGDLP